MKKMNFFIGTPCRIFALSVLCTFVMLARYHRRMNEGKM